MPYKSYALSSSKIRNRYKDGGVEFTLSPITRKNGGIMKGNITYKIYISP
jgi:hypothetical protein